MWEKQKSESKIYYQNNKRSTTGTGGGPAEVKVDPVLEQVCVILGRACIDSAARSCSCVVGVGYTQLKKIFTAINIPFISEGLYKN